MTRTTNAATCLARPSPSLLANLVVTLLAPIFLGVADGNIRLARMAVIETINDYHARNNADLIAVAQIVAFGLAALGSLSLSLADEVSLTMALRLRGNANACHRSAEQNRRALAKSHTDDPAAEPLLEFWAEDDITAFEPEKLPPLQAEDPLAGEAAARLNPPTQAPAETPELEAPAVAPAPTDQRRQEIWAIEMAQQASDITASLSTLPAAEREAALKKAASLRNIANKILNGGSVPPRAQAASPASNPL